MSRRHARGLRRRSLRTIANAVDQVPLLFEPLERRTLLAISFEGMPDWVEQGPSPITDGQVENIPGGNPVIGAVHTVLADPNNADVMYLGATNGGVWRTTNATAANPNWTPLTDQFPSLSIGAMEFDPSDATNQTIVVAHGGFSSFLGVRGLLPGLLKTTDGGDTWTSLGTTDLNGIGLSGVGPRGLVILAADNGRGSGSGGIWRSDNGGVDFDFISGINGLGNGPVFDLITDPGDPLRFYAGVGGASGGVFRTDNAGESWTNVTDAAINALVDGNTNNIEFAVHNNAGANTNAVYVGIVNNGQMRGFFRSGNLGGSWTPMDLPQTLDETAPITNASNATPIVITSNGHGLSNGDQVRVAGVTGNTAANGDFFITVINANTFSLTGSSGNGAYAGGGTWTEISGLQPSFKPGGQGGTHFSMAADPNNANIVYVGGDRQDPPFPNSVGANAFAGRLFRGDASIAANGAIPSPQWTPITNNGTAGNSSPHADSREMVFDASGDLIETDDGGIYRQTSPTDATGNWVSLIGDLRVTEMHDVAWDSVSGTIISGNQDTGTPEQLSPGADDWDSVSQADGGDVAVDTLSLPGFSIRYSSNQNLGGFRRRTYDNTGAFVAASQVSPALTVAGGGAAFVPQFNTPIAVNRFNGQRLLFGGLNSLYESTDRGENITEIAPGVSINGTDTGGLGDRGNAMAYGGRRNGIDNPDVLYVGSGSQVFVRTTNGGAITATAALPAGAGNIRDVFMDPDDWMICYAVDNDQVFVTPDAGVTWDDITGNLVATGLRTVTYVAGAAADALLVGGTGGVFRMLSSAAEVWSEYGLALPNALAFDMEYSVASDLLLVGTMGRGAWAVPTASDTIFDEACLIIDGDTDFANQDDVIRLVRDANNPLLLNVFLNNNTAVPDEQIPLASITCIEINGLGGEDTITIDGTNGQIGVPGDILINGNSGNDDIDASGATGDNVVINGNAGDDVIEGGDGDDEIDGGADDDILIASPGGDDMVGGTGLDTADFTARTTDLTITTFDNLFNDGDAGEGDNIHADVETVLGGSGDDDITGAAVANLLEGNDGDDTVEGLGGNDTVNGNDGNDDLSGGAGDDVMSGGDGHDEMSGGDDNDTMFGNAGSDIMHGDDGADRMLGGTGGDRMLGGADNDQMEGNDDDDHMEGNGGDDDMLGNAGEDDMIGGSAIAGAADGADDINGGADADVIAGDNAMIGHGAARYTAGVPAGTGLGLENNALIRTVTLLDLDTIGAADVIRGEGGDDTTFGQLGDDQMFGDAGHDDMIGHLGADIMDGGDGDDGIIGDKGTIVSDLLDGSTQAEIKTQDHKIQVTINVADTRQRFVTLDDPTNGSADVITGGAGNDFIHAGAGNDTASGNDGSDAIFGNAGDDDMNGNAGDDHLFGAVGNDLLDGGPDADIIYGGDGQDALTGDNEADRLVDWSGNFNTFFVPGPSYGAKIIIRSPSAQVQQFLLDLAAGDGATDPALEIALIDPGSPGNHGNGVKGK